MHRRSCLKMLGMAGLAKPFEQVMPFFMSSPTGDTKNFAIHIFSKHLQWLNYDEMAKTAKSIGFDGVDLTVRPKGHVLPAKVETDLVKAVDAIRKAGLKAEMITTEITSASEPHTETILKTASRLGIKSYRMGWLNYDAKQPIAAQIEGFKPRFKELEQLNEHYKIRGDYQNHAGTSVGAAVWDIYMVIKDLNPAWVGCQYDIRHAMVEGLNSWEVSLKLLQSHIRTLGVKDFIYTPSDKGWTIKNTPLGEGVVDLKKYFQKVNELAIVAPISLHAEYDLGGAGHGDTKLSVPPAEVITALRQDLNRLKAAM